MHVGDAKPNHDAPRRGVVAHQFMLLLLRPVKLRVPPPSLSYVLALLMV